MSDTLQVTLEISDDKAAVVLDKFRRRMETTGTLIDSVAKKKIISDKSAQSFDLVEAKAEKLRRTLDAVSKNQLGKGFDSMAFLADRASQKVGVIQTQLTNIKKLISEPSNKTVLDQLTKEAKTLEAELDKVKNKADKFNQKQTPNSKESAGGKVNEGLSAIGLPEITSAAAVAGVVAFGKNALDAAREADSAQRILRASAKETGISYDKLTESAAKFGAQTLQSNTAAQSSFAQIVTFANAAGRTDKLDEFRTKFADLAAAKGIDPSNLGEIAKQLNALTDEATDKLLNGNPSAFYDKFAKSINKTADSLTDAEKRAAVFDEVLRRGAIFSGEAEKRANASASALDRLNQKYENFKANAGKAVLPLVEFTEAAGGAFSDLAKGTNSTNDFVKKINAEIGKNPFLLPVRFTANTVDKLSRGISDIITGNRLEYETKISVQYAIDVQKTKEAVDFLRASDKEIGDAKANPFGSLKNFALSKVNIATSFFDPEARKKAISDATADAENFVKDLKEKFENPQLSGNVGLLKLARKDFQAYSNLFDSDVRYKIQQSLSSAISEGAAKGFQLALGNPKATLGDLRKSLKEVFASGELLPDTKTGLINQFESKIKQSVDEAKNKIKELEKQYLSTFDALYQKSGSSNPFVAIFAEADKALTDLRKNLKGLSPELQAQAVALQNKINSNALFSANMDNALSTANLRDEASNFRNFKPKTSEADIQNRIEDYLQADFRGTNAGNSLLRKLDVDGKGVKKTPELNQTLYEYATLHNFEVENKQNRGRFGELNQSSLISSLASQRLALANPDENKSLQEKLQKQLAIVDKFKSGAATQEQVDAANRRIVALTSVDPSKLNDRERSQAAVAREALADRQDKYQEEALTLEKEKLKVQRSIDANQKKLLEIAEKEGIKGIEALLTVKDQTSGGIEFEQKRAPKNSATKKSTADYYNDYQNALNP